MSAHLGAYVINDSKFSYLHVVVSEVILPPVCSCWAHVKKVQTLNTLLRNADTLQLQNAWLLQISMHEPELAEHTPNIHGLDK